MFPPLTAWDSTGGAFLLTGSALAAQDSAEKRASDNIEVVPHLHLGASGSVSDIEIEQDMSRPFA